MKGTANHTARPPAYRLLAGELRDDILTGAFPPTRRLPTEAELSASRGVSRQTVRHAFNELVAEGLVYRVRGRGTFAVASPRAEKYLRSLGSIDDLLALAVDTDLEVVSPFTRVLDVEAAGRLRLPSDEVATGVFRRLHGGIPFSLTTIHLPVGLGERIGRDRRVSTPGAVSPSTVIGLIEEASSTPIVEAHQSITAALVSSALAPLIDCEVGAPALRIDRLYFDARGDAVELAVSYFNPSRYSYRLALRRRVV